MSPRVPRRDRVFFGWLIVAAGFTTTLCLGEVFWSFGVFFKPLQHEFGWSRAVVSSGYMALSVGYSVSAIISGRLVDRYPSRAILLTSALVTGLAICLTSQVDSVGQFRSLLFAVGLGAGAALSVPTATVQRWFSNQPKAGLALGIVMSGVGIGALVFAPFINRVVESQGWRVGFLCAGGSFFLLVSASALVMRSSPAEVGQPSPDDSAGQLIHTKQVSAWRVMTSRRFAAIAFIAVAALVAVQILTVHLVAHATDVGVPAGLAAVALGLVGVCSVPGRLLAGLLSERIGWGRVLSLSLFGAASSFILLLTVRSAWMLYPFVVVYGVCHGIRAVGVVGLLGRLFGTRFIGQLIGTTMGGARLVGAFAPYLAGYLFDQFGSYSIAFWVLAAILAMGGMIALKIGRQ